MANVRQLVAFVFGVALLFSGTAALCDEQIVVSQDGNDVPAFAVPSTYCNYIDAVAANGGLAPSTASGWINLKSGQRVSVTGGASTATCYGRVVLFRRVAVSDHPGVWFVVSTNLQPFTSG